jgi:mannose-6-phosphate isomerase-like protein (cupin superfamily)
MPAFHTNIEQDTLKNSNFRQVIFTGKFCQLVLMTLKPGEDIGMEVHDRVDQFFRFESGQGKAIVDDKEFELKDGTALVIVAGSKHNIINTSQTEELKLYTLYSPANHPDGTTHVTKEEAEEYEKSHH